MNREIKSILEETYKRTVVPMYIFILSLIASSLLIKPKSNKYIKYYKSLIFLVGFIFIIFSQIGFKFLIQNLIIDLLVVLSPFILVIFFYFVLFLKANFNFRYL